MDPFIKGSLFTIMVFVTSEFLLKVYRRLCRAREKCTRNEDARLSNTSLQVLFFPDSRIACREHFVTGNGCYKDMCPYSHSNTALSELYKHLLSCKSTLDLCIFLLTCKDLADILARLSHRGVKVRIITDNEQLEASGSQIWSLMKTGIPVRTDDTTYLMHHKFAVVDGKILINGSFNWTRQAITCNQENLIITDDIAVTSIFVKEFQKLWDRYDPASKVSKTSGSANARFQ